MNPTATKINEEKIKKKMHPVKKFFLKVLLFFIVIAALFITFVYYSPYEVGVNSGKLTKISRSGYIFKTWEGEIISNTSGLQSFAFSVQDKDEAIIEQLKNLQGKDVKVEYVERYKAFFWWGDTPIFITKVEQDNSLNFRE
jgi:hypothetical protein